MGDQGLNPSWSTIFTLVNSMIGGTMLTLPMLFRTSGVLTGVIVLFLSGFISYKTCKLYILHMSQKQKSIEQTIKRILSRKWQNFFKSLTGIYLICLNIIYVQLIVDQGYNIIYYVLNATGHKDWIAQKGIRQLVFDKFSIQYLSLISFVPLLALIFIKNLTILIRLTSLGVLSVFIYLGFIFFQFFSGITDIHFDEIPLFRSDIGNLAGTCAIAFTIHTVVNPIMKANRFQQNNIRDLRISYLLGFLTYCVIGILGCISVLSKDCQITIVNCYLNDWQALVIEIVYFYALTTVLPCFLEVGRTRILSYYYGEVKQKHFKIFNILFMITSTIFNFFSPFLPLDEIMNLVGSILCFFFVYLIPCKFHWDCLYYNIKPEKESLISQNSQEQIRCPHDRNYQKKCPKLIRKCFYILIIIVGIAVGIYGLYQFFKDIFLD